MITGKDLLAWGFQQDKWFKHGIEHANALRARGHDDGYIMQALQAMVPVELTMRTNTLPYAIYLEPEGELERLNLQTVNGHMDALMRVPTIRAGAVMPDACPAGSAPGTIPVGGVVAAEDAIHPGFHSSDICCSMAITLLNRKDDPKRILDALQEVTHFGPGGRDKPVAMPDALGDRLIKNPFLADLGNFAKYHFATQGDGNHFAYVGHLKSTGAPAIVTHHGSRGLGAQLYKKGMAAAKRHTAIVAPRVPAHQAWMKASSRDGEAYWEALQLVREWTRASHFAIHTAAARKLGNSVADRFWNEHNFVFQKADGLYYHGKGATPSWDGYAKDDSGLTLIPMNMSEPILIAKHKNHKGALGFAPHGAGRNMSRTAFLRDNEVVSQELRELTGRGLDIRGYLGKPDLSELPSAYKSAASVRRQIESFGLAEIVDEVLPYGSIMAGEQDWGSRRR